MRLTDQLPYFVSGVAYPDWIILRTACLKSARQGIVGAGFFGIDWALQPSDSAWRTKP